MQLRRRLALGYLLIASFTALVGLFGLYTAVSVSRGFHVVSEELLPLVEALEELKHAGMRIVTSTAEYGFLGQMPHERAASAWEGELKNIAEGRARYRKTFAEYERHLERFPRQQVHLQPIRDAGEELVETSAELVVKIREGAGRDVLLPLQEKLEDHEHAYLDAVDAALQYETSLLAQNRRKVGKTLDVAPATIVVTLLAALLAATLTALRQASSISRPVTVLKHAAEEISRGRLDAPPVVTGPEEIEALGDALNKMVRDLQQAKSRIVTGRNYLNRLLDSLVDSLLVIGSDGRIRRTNPAASTLLGYGQDELAGLPVCVVLPEFSFDWDVPATRIHGSEQRAEPRQGPRIPVSLAVAALWSDEGEVEWVCLLHDLTHLRRAEEQIRHLAFYDQLTHLPNRTLFHDRLTQALAHASRSQEIFTLLYFDLDRFKEVNDSFGHATGDLLLVEISQRLTKRTRQSDTLARLGGDEFAVLSNVAGEAGAQEIARGIIEAIREPFGLGDREISIAASVGIVLFPADGTTAEELMKHADLAMYEAKRKGEGECAFFSAEMNERATRRRDLEDRLRRALKEGEFLLYYQPQVDLATGRMCGVEALVRWNDAEEGIIPAGKFIPLAEEVGLIRPLGEWVLRRACAQHREWREAGYPSMRLAVNVSGHQFSHPSFVDQVDRILEETGMDPKWLELELTESALMKDISGSVETLLDLQVRGIHLAIDDFGTGYSSLSYLKHFPINRLKIDQSFVRDIHKNKDDAAIVDAILQMARSLGLQGIAEGVETMEELQFLRQKGCGEVQGYLFARPMPAEDLVQHFGSVLLSAKPLNHHQSTRSLSDLSSAEG